MYRLDKRIYEERQETKLFNDMIQKVPKYLFEVGHGLEDSGKPFIWVVKVSEVATPEVQEWLSALEARVAGRGVVVRGWAPQLAILSHRAVGGFVTHCGCNSILEDITHGVPVVTWPHISDQFLNERLAVDVLGVGVPEARLPVVTAVKINPYLYRYLGSTTGRYLGSTTACGNCC
uniref:UDP-glycosyltransferases domain-containing protein n=1 Tax=Oryza rufipogon TaxID=4529 RepID=A0A0E0NBF1_ORYRU